MGQTKSRVALFPPYDVTSANLSINCKDNCEFKLENVRSISGFMDFKCYTPTRGMRSQCSACTSVIYVLKVIIFTFSFKAMRMEKIEKIYGPGIDRVKRAINYDFEHVLVSMPDNELRHLEFQFDRAYFQRNVESKGYTYTLRYWNNTYIDIIKGS